MNCKRFAIGGLLTALAVSFVTVSGAVDSRDSGRPFGVLEFHNDVDYFGLVRNDFSKKPGFEAYKKIAGRARSL